MNNFENKEATEEEFRNIKETPAHEKVREAFFEMQKISGAAIKPLGLLPLFYKLLKKFKPNKMNKVQARNVADVFSALQNEYYVINFDGKNVDWFYMTMKRWQKYGLGRKAVYNSIIFLAKCKIIETQVRQHPLKAQNRIRYFKFNLDMLKDITQGVKETSFSKKRTGIKS